MMILLLLCQQGVFKFNHTTPHHITPHHTTPHHTTPHHTTPHHTTPHHATPHHATPRYRTTCLTPDDLECPELQATDDLIVPTIKPRDLNSCVVFVVGRFFMVWLRGLCGWCGVIRRGWCGVVWCGVVWCGVVWCSMV